MTGYEKIGNCYWCGDEARKNSRYCSKEHRLKYLINFRWNFAVSNVFHRIKNPDGKYICEKCNKAFFKSNIEVHHIVPLNGELRFMNTKNRPENLLGLCHDCHKETHKDLFDFQAKQRLAEIRKAELEIQPELFY
jgi:5-methylcytosine-specific restriction endonuclease McrA